MTEPRIYAITGPPAAGKTTLSRLILEQSKFGFHLPIDDLRTWVTAGISESVNWTDETERQFQLAEKAACAIARTYFQNGFSIAIDHCRNLPRWNEFLHEHLPEFPVTKVLLLPDLSENYVRNHARTNKNFDPKILDDIICHTQSNYREADKGGLDHDRLNPPDPRRFSPTRSKPINN